MSQRLRSKFKKDDKTAANANLDLICPARAGQLAMLLLTAMIGDGVLSEPGVLILLLCGENRICVFARIRYLVNNSLS